MAELWKLSTGMEKLGAIFRSPAWKPKAYVHAPARAVSRATYSKYSVYASKFTRRYVLGHYVVILVATFLVMAFGESMGKPVLYLSCASIVLALASLGGLLEHKSWATYLEALRLMVAGVAIAVFVMSRVH